MKEKLMDERRKKSITKFVTIQEGKETVLEKQYKRGFPVEFRRINSESLRVFIDYRMGTLKELIGGLSFLIISTILLIISIIIEQLEGIVAFSIFFLIMLIFNYLLWIHLKNYTCEFNFNKTENSVIKSGVYFGRIFWKKEYKISEIYNISCYYLRKRGPFTIYLRIHFATFKKLKMLKKVYFYTAKHRYKADDYCNELSNFLKVGISYIEETSAYP